MEQALTNVFELMKYHGMLFLKITNSDWDYLVPNWHPTNGYILYPSSPIASIPLDTGIIVPYFGIFYVDPQSSNDMKQTTVTVRTLRAEVIDGTETGVHGGVANHTRKIAPVRQEEENVLEAIAKELGAAH